MPELLALRAGLGREFAGLDRRGIAAVYAEGYNLFDHHERIGNNGQGRSIPTSSKKMSTKSDFSHKEVILASQKSFSHSDALKFALMTQEINISGLESAAETVLGREHGVRSMELFAA